MQDETSLRDLKVYEAKSSSRIIEVNQAQPDSDSDSELSEEENQESQSGSSARSRPRRDEDKILQNCNLILENIRVSFNEEHLDNSILLDEDLSDLKASTEIASDDLTQLVNNIFIYYSASEVGDKVLIGDKVLKVRNEMVQYLEQAAKKVKERESSHKERNSKIQEAFERKKAQFEELEEQKIRLSREKEILTEELSHVKAEMEALRSAYSKCEQEKVELRNKSSDLCVQLNELRDDSRELEQTLKEDLSRSQESLEETTSDLKKAKRSRHEANKNLAQTNDTLASMTVHCKRLEEEVENLKPLQVLNENLMKENESLRGEVQAVKEDQATQLEKERLLTSLQECLNKKLQEKEVIVAESKGQLQALRNELLEEKQRICLENEIITLDAPYDKKNKLLESRISDQRKRLFKCEREEERLRSEVRQHLVNLAMIKSGINQLISDPSTPTSMIHSLKLLRHSSMFSAADAFEGPDAKKVKIERDIKEEYFEHVDIKRQVTPDIKTNQLESEGSVVSGQQTNIAPSDNDTTEEFKTDQDSGNAVVREKEDYTEDNLTM